MKPFMKTIAVLICVLCMGAASTAGAKASAASPYTLEATVYESESGSCTLVDSNGESWAYESDKLMAGQDVLLTMSDNGTPADITDDVILNVETLHCPYTVGPLGRYIAGGTLEEVWVENDGTICAWISDDDGNDWFVYDDLAMSLMNVPVGQHLTLIVNAANTSDDFSDDIIEDVLFADPDEND